MRIMTYWKHGQGIWPTLAFQKCRVGISRLKYVNLPGNKKRLSHLKLHHFWWIPSCISKDQHLPSSHVPTPLPFALVPASPCEGRLMPSRLFPRKPMDFVYLLVVGPVSFHNNPNFWITTGSAAKFMIWCLRDGIWSYLIQVFDSNTSSNVIQ